MDGDNDQDTIATQVKGQKKYGLKLKNLAEIDLDPSIYLLCDSPRSTKHNN